MLNYALWLVTACLASLMTYLLCSKQLNLLKGVLDDLRKINVELLNRVQAKDLHAFSTLQANTNPASVIRGDEESYIPRSDEGEYFQLERLQKQYGHTELGDTLYQNDEEYEQTMRELGLGWVGET